MKYADYYSGGDLYQRALEKRTAGELLSQKGLGIKPPPPRSVQATAGSRKVILTWELPPDTSNIVAWRVYENTERQLVEDIPDIGRRYADRPADGGTTPPKKAFFVSSLSASGTESAKIQVIASAKAETGAPVDSAPPSAWSSSSAGGGTDDRDYAPTGRDRNVL